MFGHRCGRKQYGFDRFAFLLWMICGVLMVGEVLVGPTNRRGGGGGDEDVVLESKA